MEWSNPLTLEQIIHQIWAFNRISVLDRQLLLTVADSDFIVGDRERVLLDQLHDAIHKGTLAIV
ncbi:MAG: hypothetical protein SAJ12_24600 [Jaaginema sp. PMC 1079.18]|nr:hypothetical protein [Jaaginema sp. PMC 1080.18]MEC4854175.1 hypothetical protein [Jaaginema sp. PMC 1079.18]MEC4867765.1 hypothetical protein [Jaaginema sp. PMC 1078.18]